jgi:gliding motility-associated-like protein
MISFLDLPDFSLGEDRAACPGEEVTVMAPAFPSGLLNWEDGSTVSERIFTDSGLHWLEIEDGNGCIGRDSVLVNFTEIPVFDLGADTTVCDDAPFRVLATTSAGQLYWPDGSSSNDFIVDSPGQVVASLNVDGCVFLDTVLVNFRECIFFKSYIPTAFSPNSDGINDVFQPLFDDRLQILSFRLQVFSRWGEQVFLTEDTASGWDGTFRGEPADMGVYIYAVDITYQDDYGVNSEVISGDVTILK